MNKKMLKAFVEELGHDHKNLLIGPSCGMTRDPYLLLDISAAHITAKKRVKNEDSDEDQLYDF